MNTTTTPKEPRGKVAQRHANQYAAGLAAFNALDHALVITGDLLDDLAEETGEYDKDRAYRHSKLDLQRDTALAHFRSCNR